MITEQYAERDPTALDRNGGHYCRHVAAMTEEGLHSKSAIAAELGWRDQRIAELARERDAANAKAEQYKNDWHAAKTEFGTARSRLVAKHAAECAKQDARIAELEESNSMACETPVSGCDCAGCSYAAEVNGK